VTTITELMTANDSFEAPCDIEQLGLGFESPPPQAVLVNYVASKSWAEQVGFNAGMEVVELNGKLVAQMSTPEFTLMLKERPLDFRMTGRFNHILNSIYDEVPDALSRAIRSTPRTPRDRETWSTPARRQRRMSTGRTALLKAMQDLAEINGPEKPGGSARKLTQE